MATLPQQAPGPGPTAQALPSYLSYSAAATNVVQYTSVLTQVVYDPQGAFGPYQTLSTVRGTTTSIDYSIVNVPLLYTGPFPAPDLGTLYTTPGQILPSQTRASNAPGGSTSGAASSVATESAAAPSQPATSAVTAASQPESPTPAPSTTDTAASIQDGSVTADSAPSTSLSPTATSPTTLPPTSPTLAPSTANTAASSQEGSVTAESAATTSPSPTATSPTSLPPNSAAPTASTNSLDSSATGPTATQPPSSIISPTNTSAPSSTNTETTLPSTTGSAATTSSDPSATAAGAPNPQNRSSSGLSGGQIAGIVLGAFFALLLLLLLLLCCLRRRRRRRHERSILAAATGSRSGSQAGGGARGNYASIGAGAGAAGLGAAGAAAGARRRGSIDSDEWEEDHLSGGGPNSGFFVVGGQRLGPDRPASLASRRSRGSNRGGSRRSPSYSAANVAPSASSNGARTAGFASLAAAGAGFFGAAFKRKKDKPRVEIEEEQPLSDDDLGNGSMAERRGLMPFHDSPGSGHGSGAEMREASPRLMGPAAAMLGPSGAALYYSGRRRGDSGDPESPSRARFQTGQGLTLANAAASSASRPASSGAFSGSGSGTGSSSHATGATGSSHTQRAGGAVTMSSSNSTGGFTTSGGSGSGTSLPPPPRAPRTSPRNAGSMTFGNVPPTSGTTFAPGAGDSNSPNPRFSTDTFDSDTPGMSGLSPALLGLGGGAALGGLAALAAGHRDSGGSTDSGRNPALRASHASGMSEDELRHLRSTDPERYSRFISSGSNLLGPDYKASPEVDEGASSGVTTERASPENIGAFGPGAPATGRTRLATIPSVSEFGDRSDGEKTASQSTGTRTASSQDVPPGIRAVSGNSGSLGAASTGSRRIVSPLPVYEQQQAQGGESLPTYSARDQPAALGTERRPSEGQLSERSGQFVTPPDSPRNIRRSSEVPRHADDGEADVGEATFGPQDDDDDPAGADHTEAGDASAGILGGVAAGWRRLTMGQYAWIPGTSSPSRGGQQASSAPRDSSGDLDDDLEGRGSHDTQPFRASEDSSRLIHPSRRTSRFETSEASGLAPQISSQRASVYGASALGHGTSGSSPAHASSKEASGSSGEQQARIAAALGSAAAVRAAASSRQRSYPSLSSQNSRGGGYAASHSNSSMSGRRTASDNSGLDSLSAVAQLSSRSTGSGSSRSGYLSSGRSGVSPRTDPSLGSGASTGAASYSPSGLLSRDNTTSTRGVAGVDESARTGDATYYPSRRSGETASSIVTDAAEAATSEGDFTSSRATGGGSSLEKRKRPRSSGGLNSLQEDPFGDVEAPEEMPAEYSPTGGYYPSDSLGAAATRSAAQRFNAAPEDAATALPQRRRIRSLQPGAPAPAPTALAPSLSTPSPGSVSNVDLSQVQPQHSQLPSTGSGSGLSGLPASASWRPSPRVASASSAAEAQAALLRAQERRPSGPRDMLGAGGGPTPPRTQAGSPSAGNRGASLNWADIDSNARQTDVDVETAAQGADPSMADPDESSRSFGLGRFLRF
ncbi:hypothetical protein PHBOTO_001309 [Pseudozyma hubeiensis]|nr:hypothetical protein PHBOTO_001309 [Pseudozyma hubeiensis]